MLGFSDTRLGFSVTRLSLTLDLQLAGRALGRNIYLLIWGS